MQLFLSHCTTWIKYSLQSVPPHVIQLRSRRRLGIHFESISASAFLKRRQGCQGKLVGGCGSRKSQELLPLWQSRCWWRGESKIAEWIQTLEIPNWPREFFRCNARRRRTTVLITTELSVPTLLWGRRWGRVADPAVAGEKAKWKKSERIQSTGDSKVRYS